MKSCENCGNPKSSTYPCTEKCCYEWSMWMPKGREIYACVSGKPRTIIDNDSGQTTTPYDFHNGVRVAYIGADAMERLGKCGLPNTGTVYVGIPHKRQAVVDFEGYQQLTEDGSFWKHSARATLSIDKLIIIE